MSRSFPGSATNNIETSGASSRYSGLITWTLSAWAYPTAGTSGGGTCLITTNGPVNSRLPFNLGWGGDVGGVRDFWTGYWNGSWHGVSGGTTRALNAWYHVVGTYSTSSQNATLWINGAIAAGPTNIGTNTTQGTDLTCYWGRRWDTGGTPFFQGYMSKPTIWNTVLTDSQIKALARGAPPTTIQYSAIQNCLTFDRPTLIDRGPNNVGLTVQGTVSYGKPEPHLLGAPDNFPGN